ncbi:uncharacterized protein [Blastocystis hominis]|uniref:Uncharacterized protein n=1 Tax=Blastocystis hominis TaxID=12968 RepID=D8LWY9_BLAHO|nr:uncharacterized protein [Blastocystis hominis]CBK20784.2 unnamed protein product [Blastocystis hominis]|eukprot:XP_012894832.1 uncharacterized protein [Blastocystis hominis]
MTKVPFSLTYIQYDKEDGIVGWVMALVSLTPVFFVCILCSSILLHRDMHSVFFLIQMILCTIFNQILKHLIKQPRPLTGGVQQTYGMPSDHSQFMSCFCIYFTLWLCNKWVLFSFKQSE